MRRVIARVDQAFVSFRVARRDAGSLLDGQPFVLGRFGDAVKVRGVTIVAEDLKAALIDAALPARHVRSRSHQAGKPTVLIAVEHGHPGGVAPRGDGRKREPSAAAGREPGGHVLGGRRDTAHDKWQD